MRGLYVYCINSHQGNLEKVKSQCVEFGDKIYLFPFKDIGALVSEIDLDKFDEKEIKDKLQNDPEWTARNIKQHHEVIVDVGRNNAVIPLKFGTIFKTKENFEVELKKYYRTYKRLLSWFADKQEWGMKVYLDSQKFIERLRKRNPEIQQLEKKKRVVSEGMRWYLDRKVDKLINQKLDGEIEHCLSEIINELKRDAEKVVVNNPLETELTDKDKEMILNTACLVKAEKIKAFQENWQRFLKAFDTEALEFEMSGPWPPYNFVEIKNDNQRAFL